MQVLLYQFGYLLQWQRVGILYYLVLRSTIYLESN